MVEKVDGCDYMIQVLQTCDSSLHAKATPAVNVKANFIMFAAMNLFVGTVGAKSTLVGKTSQPEVTQTCCMTICRVAKILTLE